MEKQKKSFTGSRGNAVRNWCVRTGNGSAGINEATQMVTSYFDPATQLIYAIGAVVGLIGALRCTTNSVPATPTRVRPQLRGSVRVSS